MPQHNGIPMQPIVQRERKAIPVSQFHTVTPGQNLGHVAAIHGVSQEELMMANPGKIMGGRLIPGTRLNVPAKSHPFRLG